jgi:hypothetical protein
MLACFAIIRRGPGIVIMLILMTNNKTEGLQCTRPNVKCLSCMIHETYIHTHTPHNARNQNTSKKLIIITAY